MLLSFLPQQANLPLPCGLPLALLQARVLGGANALNQKWSLPVSLGKKRQRGKRAFLLPPLQPPLWLLDLSLGAQGPPTWHAGWRLQDLALLLDLPRYMTMPLFPL